MGEGAFYFCQLATSFWHFLLWSSSSAQLGIRELSRSGCLTETAKFNQSLFKAGGQTKILVIIL
ncbi:MAG: hypothetical protein C5B53_09030 [Candidatus Melainabacteria bacterium]|nr:MAG: hypothetical protein C5B53_09030 [Candidatus Melainabacteria bacterium]